MNVLDLVSKLIDEGEMNLESGDDENALKKFRHAKELTEDIMLMMISQGYYYPQRTLSLLYFSRAFLIKSRVGVEGINPLNDLECLLVEIGEMSKLTQSAELFNAIWKPLSTYAVYCLRNSMHDRLLSMCKIINEYISLVEVKDSQQLRVFFNYSIESLRVGECTQKDLFDYITSMFNALRKQKYTDGIDNEEYENQLLFVLNSKYAEFKQLISNSNYSSAVKLGQLISKSFDSALETEPSDSFLVAKCNVLGSIWLPCLKIGRLDLAIDFFSQHIICLEQLFFEYGQEDVVTELRSLRESRKKILIGSSSEDVLDQIDLVLNSIENHPS